MKQLKLPTPSEKVAVVHYSTAGFSLPTSNEIFNLFIYWNDSLYSFKQESEREEIEAIEGYAVMISEILAQGGRIVHWNQNSDAWGDRHIEMRYKEIAGRALGLSYGSDSINLSYELIKLYGNDYAEHPRLDYLAKQNNFSAISTDYPSVIYDMERCNLVVKIWYAAINGTLKTKTDKDRADEFSRLMLNRLKSELRGELGQDVLLTRSEAAELLKVSMGTMTNWVRDGSIKFTRIGRRLYFLKSQILKSNSIQTQ